MKTAILIVFFLLSSFYLKADTISTWKVYYNSKFIKEFASNSPTKEIQIERATYKKGDFIAIEYSDDRPCQECVYEILIETEHKMEVFFDRFVDKYKRMKFNVERIISDSEEDQLDTVIVSLVEVRKGSLAYPGTRLFTVKII